MRTLVSLIAIVCCAVLLSPVHAKDKKKGKDKGKAKPATKQTRFVVTTSTGKEVKGVVITPEKTTEGKPWVWRAYFNKSSPFASGILSDGYTVVHLATDHLSGSKGFKYTADEVNEAFDKAYEKVTTDFGLSERCIFATRSRGGLPGFIWAAKNVDKVAAIYGNNIVADMRSWPGGLIGEAKGSPGTWELMKKVYGFKSDEEALHWKGNPIDVVSEIAKAKIPVVIAYSPTDTSVPPVNNALVLKKNYDANKPAGSLELKLVNVGNIGHKHTTSQEQTKEILDFLRDALTGDK